MGVTIRAMAAADREPARAMLTACGAFSDIEVQTALEMIQSGLDGEYDLLAVADGEVLRGYACFGPAPLTLRSWYLYWICIARDAQATGIGGRLQSAVEAAICDRGGTRLVLETSGRPDYARARRFYRNGGFAEVGRIPDFYDRNDDCIIYCKTLSGGVSA